MPPPIAILSTFRFENRSDAPANAMLLTGRDETKVSKRGVHMDVGAGAPPVSVNLLPNGEPDDLENFGWIFVLAYSGSALPLRHVKAAAAFKSAENFAVEAVHAILTGTSGKYELTLAVTEKP